MMVCGTRRFQRRGHWGEFGMMGMRARFFGPGEVRLALLSLIADGPKHGYELMRQLEERSGGIYSASAGTVYPTLQQLEDEELISSDSKEGKRVYAITDAGAAELKREDEKGADAHIDSLAKKYLNQDKYPFRQPGEQRVTYVIEPASVHVMG